jgi:hypothetical protein
MAKCWKIEGFSHNKYFLRLTDSEAEKESHLDFCKKWYDKIYVTEFYQWHIEKVKG